MGAYWGSSTGGSSQSLNGATYTDHWSNGDPYTHNLLVHRYGIKAEQLDGVLDTLGISYDKKRINGKKLLDWEAKSNLDVRAIVAIALNESSLGTAGVATNPGSNMFGLGRSTLIQKMPIILTMRWQLLDSPIRPSLAIKNENLQGPR